MVRRSPPRSARFAVLVVVLCLLGSATIGTEASAGVEVLTVDVKGDGVDTNPGNGVCRRAGGGCSLRAAIMEANLLAGEQRIVVPPGIYQLSVTGVGDGGDLDITDDLVLDGRGATVRWADAVPTETRDRVIGILSTSGTVDVTIDDLTVRTGFLDDQPGAGIHTQEGGATTLTVSLERVRLIGNTVAGSTSSAIGGGLLVGAGVDVDLIDSTVSGNTADRGAGIFVSTGSLDIFFSTVSGNAGRIAGVNSYGTLRLLGSTVSGNTDATQVGGVAVSDGAATIVLSTIASNDGLDLTQATGAVTIRNTIIGGTCSFAGGATTVQGGSLEVGTTCGFTGPTNMQNAALALEPLRDNGGPTPTHALRSSSDALGAASGTFLIGCGDPDQRGVPRGGDPCDSGAYELVRCEGGVVDHVGTSRRDRLGGTGAADTFLLLGGNDVAAGKGGPDRFCGGPGRDRLSGGDGDDHLDGGPNRDTCLGGPGTDRASSCERRRSIP